jgi:hypothetical protein
MPVFMVERFLPELGPEDVEAQARRDGAVARSAGLRHVRTTYSREDELCFSVFEASSRDAVLTANDRAAMAYERVSEVVDARAVASEEGS